MKFLKIFLLILAFSPTFVFTTSQAIMYSDVTSAVFLGEKDDEMVAVSDCSSMPASHSQVIKGKITKPIKFCADLVFNGYFDWRVPTLEELIQIERLGLFPASCNNDMDIGTFTRGDEKVNTTNSTLTKGSTFIYYNRNSSNENMVIKYKEQNENTTGSYICVR